MIGNETRPPVSQKYPSETIFTRDTICAISRYVLLGWQLISLDKGETVMKMARTIRIFSSDWAVDVQDGDDDEDDEDGPALKSRLSSFM